MAGYAAAAPTAPGSAEPDGKRCVVDPTDDVRTVDSLMRHCTTEQILALFDEAPVGAAPTGTKKISLLPLFQVSGKHLSYPLAQQMTLTQGRLGDTLTFTTRQGRPWVYKDYITGRDAGGPLVESVSRIDQKPVYAADFSRDFHGVELSLHEYRQLTPGVWIGRDIGGGDKPTSTPTGGAIALS
ncbi:hypothetical protein [Gordonia caeni]|uniref:Uncharacterized protein n=1 Tax=Gordonia caeni TaxID=1007097 RepID=A0ABP7NY52_9ACTN